MISIDQIGANREYGATKKHRKEMKKQGRN
jgi:hypothetical protein